MARQGWLRWVVPLIPGLYLGLTYLAVSTTAAAVSELLGRPWQR